MTVGEYCSREVVIVDGGESVRDAARLMREYHVGDVVVVEERHGRRFPVGIVTDRDLAIAVIAKGLAPDSVVVRDLITSPPTLLREEDSLSDALDMMRTQGIRRLPVVGSQGELLGIIAVDDITGLVAELLDSVSATVGRQRPREAAHRQEPV